MDYMKIKKARQKKGYSQADMARLLMTHINTYRLWEYGCGQPSPENMQKLKKVLDINEKDDNNEN